MLTCDDDVFRSGETLTSSCQPNGCKKELNDGTNKEQSTALKNQTDQSKIQSSTTHQSWQLNQCSSQSVFYYISPEETQLAIHAHGTCQREDNDSRAKVTFDSIGGLQKQVGLVREMIELPLKHPEMFTNHGK